MRIDSSFSGHMDVHPIGKSQGNSVENTVGSAAAGEANPMIKDFKMALSKEDSDLIIDSLKTIPTELTPTRLEFKIHDETKRVMVRIVDRVSDELISEIPPEKFLDLIAGLWKQAGLIVDERV
ncbi:flagellar protein FlaG [Tepidanaerobacter acetatoxydans]|uniref:flagellar protein FlaG n=1 Tax=Tepidanaerobacter acetatoxydans TaxID=499229 RepID=UPI001BD2BF1C|nr:flagellar protein FlaG [Tepidanaerobacter acetatoxydans]